MCFQAKTQKARHWDPFIDDSGGGGPATDNGVRFQNITELRTAMDSGAVRSYGSPVMTLKDTIDNHYTGYGNSGGSTVVTGRSASQSGADVVDGVLPNGADSTANGDDAMQCGRLSDEFRRQSSPGPVPLRQHRATDASHRAYPRQVRVL